MKRLNISINPDGTVKRDIENVSEKLLPENDLLIKVAFSSLNYKDALSANGFKGVSKNYPHTPGIDASGIVVLSRVSGFSVGDKVIVTGHDLGMNTRGGFSEFISVPASWVVHLPENISLKQAMIFGTAGLTAAMSVDKISNNDLYHAPVLISGATGGVGSLALMILKKLGVETVAYTRRPEMEPYLKNLGVKKVISSLEISEKPLLKGLYSAGIDTVGGSVLENMLKQILNYGSIAVCGMASSPYFSTSVYPFILRGITLFGIESAEALHAWRSELWNKLANDWMPENLEDICRTVTLEALDAEITHMLEGKSKGRVLVDLETL